MAEIKNLKSLMTKLDARVASAIKTQGVSVVVGYTAAYAVYVHEMIPGQPRPPMSDAQRRAMFAKIRENERRGHVPWGKGQPKFLEQPARQMSNDGTFALMIHQALQRGRTVAQALLACGLRLQRESMKLCPIDTGNLRASAFTRLEVGGNPGSKMRSESGGEE